MKRLFFAFLLPSAMLMSAANSAFAQTSGEITYALPSTTIHMEVEAIMEYHTPGPLAKYAEKYLGISASSSETSTCSLTDIKITRLTEADPSAVFTVIPTTKQTGTEKFLKMTSQGVISMPGESNANENIWRFPSASDYEQPGAVTSNLTSDQTTLYRTEKNQSGSFDRVAVRQSQVVEKSPEKKAQEAAEMIFRLRQKRVDIITGDTDASFTGEAMKAAIDEITRMENEYTELFLGKISTSIQKACFDVVPNYEDDVYVAFRISDTEGLVAADNIGGRIVMLQLNREGAAGNMTDDPKTPRSSIRYRTPAICVMKLIDGQQTLLTSRIPVYQKGSLLTMPL